MNYLIYTWPDAQEVGLSYCPHPHLVLNIDTESPGIKSPLRVIEIWLVCGYVCEDGLVC